ncbi:radical SAM/SPASM domain-containing protein [Lachnotalea glycerini]|uniref:SPASM domain-containing protein n=1 Tax=Lachnotalea glycerini TaxID=1763509 RepID=A0A371JC56_9FIRM|nr:radical SAM protein [Lachnotalea glycerini]RDY30268.1 SPASM domain-containing protein [Lachnotalea glycerini]
MYNLSLEIVNQCNLNCTYCYLGEKKNHRMSKDIALKAMDIAIHESKKQYDKSLLVYFIGGEPLMAYEFMVFCTNYIKKKCEEYDLYAYFSTTINGTLLNQDKINFFIKYNFDLKISIDGIADTHDLNRAFYDSRGSYKEIITKLPFIWEYEEKTGKMCHVANVITTNNYYNLLDNLIHLTNLGFKFVESGIDIYSKWDENDIEKLCKQLEISFDYYKKMKEEKSKAYWKFFEDRIQNLYSEVHFYGCKAGLISIYVTVDGYIYPCSEIDERVRIGSVWKGLNVEKIRSFINYKMTQNKECLECEDLRHCKASGCIMNNYEVNKDFFKPISISCFITKFFIEMIRTKLSTEQQEAFLKYYQKKV